MSTAVLERKYQKLFTNYDSDGDGFITRAELEASSTNLSRNLGEEDSPKARRHAEATGRYWDAIARQVGTTDRIRAEEWVDAAHQIATTPEFKQVINELIDATHELCDTDGDGHISLREFQQAHRASGASEADAARAFERMDTDGDGRVSREETARAAREYFTSSDPKAAGNSFF
ncbi:EF-hand domain-containing protein [Phytomonospora endophytica]|uniref:Ca2+-binding EF-hand superfamily protein n=1 Tax=Phytomonospora endophytica TaxID=714109 RepID=A0A841FS36_9ACTN|nr:EF-hand domain-containing protein [Phytomonospora endophytica]MBB6038614.1 Ca2+-binding EF-hand superfamily protein [Phytomonospora endophytica]GIG69242.1 calcium-binding protein [Phytomonospora endophytica]